MIEKSLSFFFFFFQAVFVHLVLNLSNSQQEIMVLFSIFVARTKPPNLHCMTVCLPRFIQNELLFVHLVRCDDYNFSGLKGFRFYQNC